MGVRVAVTARPALLPLRLARAPKQTLTRHRLRHDLVSCKALYERET